MKIIKVSKGRCWMVIQKDIIVTQGLGLDIKTLNHVSKSSLDVRGGGSLGLQPFAGENGV